MIRVMEGDCRAVLATLPAQSVQCCVTSPPYYGLRQYLPEGHPDMDKQIGLEKSPDEYVAEMVAVFREVRRVLRDDGVLWINIGDSYASGGNGPGTGKETRRPGEYVGPKKAPPGYKPKDLIGIPWMVAFALRADGWYLRSEVIWAKPNPMPESVTDRPTKAHEQVFLLSKSARYFYDADAIKEDATWEQNRFADQSHEPKRVMAAATGNAALRNTAPGGGTSPFRNARTIWTIATQPYSGAHFATMPPDLAERCIKAGSSEKGCCPHCGAPWGRVVERSFDHATAAAIAARRSSKVAKERNDPEFNKLSGTEIARLTTVTAGGWSPSCDCPTHDPIPCTILDPFGGAGTTALVADRLNRNATIIELNPEYAALARERVTADAGMFAHVA